MWCCLELEFFKNNMTQLKSDFTQRSQIDHREAWSENCPIACAHFIENSMLNLLPFGFYLNDLLFSALWWCSTGSWSGKPPESTQRGGGGGEFLSHGWLFATPWNVAHQAPLSVEISRQEYWSGLPFPSPGDLPDPGTGSLSLALQADSLLLSHQGSPQNVFITHKNFVGNILFSAPI